MSVGTGVRWVFALAVLATTSACSDDDMGNCTLEIRSAVKVRVETANGEPIDDASVTAINRGAHIDCGGSFEGNYFCSENAGGEYAVTVLVDGVEKSETVSVHKDGCHVSEAAEVTFVF